MIILRHLSHLTQTSKFAAYGTRLSKVKTSKNTLNNNVPLFEVPESFPQPSQLEPFTETIAEENVTAALDLVEKVKGTYLDTSKLSQSRLEFYEKILEITDVMEQAKELAKLNNTTVVAVKTFNELIYINAIAKNSKKAMEIFNKMKELQMKTDHRTYSYLLHAFADHKDSGKIEQIIKTMEKDGIKKSLYTYSVLIKMYAKRNNIEQAFREYEKLKEEGIEIEQPIYTTLIAGCIRSFQLKRAWSVFEFMRTHKHLPDEITYSAMIHACSRENDTEKALNLFEEMINFKLNPTNHTINNIINACAKRKEYFETALAILQKMQNITGFTPNFVTYNSILSGCWKNRNLKKAREMFLGYLSMVEKKNIEPHKYTFTTMLGVYATFFNIKETRDYLEISSKNPINLSSKKISLIEALNEVCPKNIDEIFTEADKLFSYFCNTRKVEEIDTFVINSYLYVYTNYLNLKKANEIYTTLYDKYNCKHNGFTFQQMIFLYANTEQTEMMETIYNDFLNFYKAIDTSKESTDTASKVEIIRIGASKEQIYKIKVLTIKGYVRKGMIKEAFEILDSISKDNRTKGLIELWGFKELYYKLLQLDRTDLRIKLYDYCRNNEKDPVKNVNFVNNTFAMKNKNINKPWNIPLYKRRKEKELYEAGLLR